MYFLQKSKGVLMSIIPN